MSAKPKILVVDDNADNIDILIRTLGKKYFYEKAISGEEALKIAENFRPSIILLDIMMPGIDGYETCRRLRANPKLFHTKIIMVSAKTMVEERLLGYDAGADDYVVKPFNRDELRAKVRTYLRLKTVEEVDRIKTDMIRLLSHETRTPLNAVIGFADLLYDDETLSEEHKEFVECIKNGGEYLLRFFKKVLLISSLTSDKTEMLLLPRSIKSLIEGVIKKLDLPFREKKIIFSFDISFDDDISFDEYLLGKALRYVVENAVKYSPQKGDVSILTEKDGDNCLIKVSDQGDGIKEEYLEEIFEPFAAKCIEHHQEGYGLSLAIARKIMEMHCGSLTAANNRDKGALFVFTLPVTML